MQHFVGPGEVGFIVALYRLLPGELTAYEKVCFENRLLPKFMSKVKDAVSGQVTWFLVKLTLRAENCKSV